MTSKLLSITRQYPNKKFFLVNWMLHDRCTYNCSYCPPANKAGNDDWLSIDFSKQFADRLEEWLTATNKNENVMVSFTGGEPTVWPKFIELVDYINSKGWMITMTTNGSRSLAWWQENQQKFYKINFSFHSEFADKAEFLEKVTYLTTQRNPSLFGITVMMNPFRWDYCTEMASELAKTTPPVVFDIRPLQPFFGLQKIDILPYTTDQLEYIHTTDKKVKEQIKKHYKPIINMIQKEEFRGYNVNYTDRTEKLNPNELIIKKLVNFNGWTCNAGLEQIFINSLGKIYVGTCLEGELLGNIQKPNKINWPTNPVVCRSNWCGCYTDIMTSKWKNTNE
jgi:MoaA/NifB/PqqE/SkfB family radical SAM enzyme